MSNTISGLPDEALEKILEYAIGNGKGPGLLNPSLVCKKWNDLITQSSQIWRHLKPKITLKLAYEAESALDEVQIARKCRELKLGSDSEYPYLTNRFPAYPITIMQKISSSLGVHLRKLTLFNLVITPCYFNTLHLSLLNLNSLSLEGCRADNTTSNFEPVHLKYLMHLRLKNTPNSGGSRFLSWLSCSKLMMFAYEEWEIDSIAVKFLNQLEQLDELIFAEHSSFEAANNLLSPQFKWRKLRFGFPVRFYTSSIEATNIRTLFKSSTHDAYAHIDFCMLTWLRNELSDLLLSILNECKVIKCVKTMIFRTKENIEIIMDKISMLRQMNEVEKLELCIPRGMESQLIAMLIGKLPNVKEMVMTGRCSSKHLNQLAEMMKKINHLNVAKMDFECYGNPPPELEWISECENAVFASLQTFTVRAPVIHDNDLNNRQPLAYGPTKSLWNFCQANSSLKKVIVQQVDGPWWQVNSFKGEVTEQSLICLYKEWLLNQSSVTCILKMTQEEPVSSAVWKSREHKEFAVFGRALNGDEKKFFSEIVFD